MNLTTIKIKGVDNIREIYKLFKDNKTWHMPIRNLGSNEYGVTVKECDPTVSYLQLKYGNINQN